MITVAIERSGWVYVYSGNDMIFKCQGQLYGYTSQTVSVIGNKRVYSYDCSEKIVSNQPL